MEGSLQTRVDLCAALLRGSKLELLQRQTRTEPAWSSIYRGFRPQTLTRSIYVKFAHVFARNERLASELQEVFLDSYGVTPAANLTSRWKAAGAATLPDGEPRELVQLLSERDFTEFPSTSTVSVLPSMADETGVGEASTSTEPEDSEAAEEVSELSTEHKLPEFVTERQELEWSPPTDDIAGVQEATTLFERIMIAFIQRQLQGLYGDAWLRKGCGQWRRAWRERAPANGPVADSKLEPKSLLGYAHIGEYAELIVSTPNWPAFEPYFQDKTWFITTYSLVTPLRLAGMHAGDRDIRLIDHAARLRAMADVVACFNLLVAERITEIWESSIAAPDREETSPAGAFMSTNLADFANPAIIGRDNEIQSIENFWKDEFARVLSITGQGGVGKSALLDGFTYQLLASPLNAGQRPKPEAIVYLTAKDNYLKYMKRAPKSLKFRTARRLFEATIEVMGGQTTNDDPTEDLRLQVLSAASEMPILFLLDNLESLTPVEHEALRNFLDDLPRPSKAILTTRIDRRIGRSLNITGLSKENAKDLLISRLPEVNESDMPFVDSLIEYTEGLPLALLYVVNAVSFGRTLEDAVEAIRGKQFLDLLAFSFDSSLEELSETTLNLIVFLAISKTSRTRKDMLELARDEEDLDEALAILQDMSFVRRSWEEQKQNRFTLDNPMLRDYILERASKILSLDNYNRVFQKANVVPAAAVSSSLSVEIDRVLRNARQESYNSWEWALEVIEEGIAAWGEDPRLLAKQGYYQYRLGRLVHARGSMERAISKGFEDGETYAYLALVLHYLNEHDDALRRAETALALRTRYPLAEQIAGECHIAIAVRGRFMLDDQVRKRHLEDAVRHLSKSMITEEQGSNDERFNSRSARELERAERLLAEFGR